MENEAPGAFHAEVYGQEQEIYEARRAARESAPSAEDAEPELQATRR